MKPSLAIIDYGMGNLRSVQKALEQVGANAFVTDSPLKVRDAQAVVLPGVGAFGEAVRRLQRQKLWSVLEKTLTSPKPFLGICLGLQLLFERSEESRGVRGLGYLKGSVVRFKPAARKLKVPHMGWNGVRLSSKNKSPWLRAIPSGRYFYFVHSYYPAPEEKKWIGATTSYDGPFCSAVAGDHLLACQFHPEKSGDNGLQLLKQFVRRVEKVAC